MAKHPFASSTDEIADRIVTLRQQRVLLDADLARIYGVSTSRLNEQVKRNARRFPPDFVFRLTRPEAQAVASLRSQNAILKQGQHIKHLPYAFTEHGAIQAANVLNSEAAIEMGVHVVRAFLQLRQWLGTQKSFADKLDGLERKIGEHDFQIRDIIEVLRQLAAPEISPHDRKIGFHRGNR
jgi:hypothetical protein